MAFFVFSYERTGMDNGVFRPMIADMEKRRIRNIFAVLAVLAGLIMFAKLFRVYFEDPYKYNRAWFFPNKVVGPSDLRFDLSTFRFEDYTDVGWFEVFQLICVPGTSRNKVRNILVDSAKAEEKSPTRGRLVTYEGKKYIPLNPVVKRDLRSVRLYVQYDEEEKIISCRGAMVVWMRMGGYKENGRFKVKPDCKSVKDCFY